MKSGTQAQVGKAGDRRRKARSHPIPRWLKNGTELDAIAKSRMLLLLSVLSGELPVTTAIAQAKISRATYYKLEARALNAMLAVLNPLAAPAANGAADLSAAASQIALLQGRIGRLEQDKRRLERLLLLTRKSLKAPLTSGRRGPWPKRLVRVASTATSPGASSR